MSRCRACSAAAQLTTARGCALIDDDGRSCGYVDFGELGVADLAVATLSLGWNYPGRDPEAEFFGAYGARPDPARIDYYRRLWQAFDHTSDAASR
jgi:kanamycin kinase